MPVLLHNDGKPEDFETDSTGFNITIRGDYLGHKWNRKWKGWIKLQAVISVNDVSVIFIAITDHPVSESKTGRKLLESVKRG